MSSKVQISPVQVLAIIACLPYGKSIGYTNGILADLVANDSWIAMSLAFVAGLAGIAGVVWLVRRFQGRTATEAIPKVLGRPFGAAAMLTLAAFFLGNFATSAITIEQHINDYLLTETPFIVFVVGYTLLIMYGCYLGIEVAARLGLVGVLSAAAINLSMVAGSLDKLQLERLLPFMDHGLPEVLAASLVASSDVAIALAGALILLPLTTKPTKWMRSCMWGLLCGAALVLTWTVFETGVLGPEITSQYLIACMQMARAAELSIYLHRYELIMVVFFVYAVITQSLVCLYCATELTAAALPFRVRRGWLVIGLGCLAIAFQYIVAFDREEYRHFLTIPWPIFAAATGLGVPLLVGLVALLRPSATTTARSGT